MNVVNSDNYSQGPLPTVFEKQVLFEHPQAIQDAQYSKKRGGGGGMTAFLIFLAMLVPCGLLGYMMYSQDTQIKSMQQDAENAETERMDGLREQVRTLEANAGTSAQALVELEPELGRLLNDRQSKLREIRYDVADLKGVAMAERLQLEAGLREAAIASDTFNEASPPVADETEREKEIALYEAAIAEFSALPEDWAETATSNLDEHVQAIEAHRQYVINWRAATRPDPGPVVPSRGRIVTND